MESGGAVCVCVCVCVVMTGFSYELCDRNAAFVSSGAVKQPSAKKTGTTIAGVIFKVCMS